ncbi:ThiJ/PfpI family protein [Arthroderma uncinatum]|uniref:ThiJ/PfpI family protein n=1 Tax=Arthroderma uncinatum TaxID=74035 RepID=UPI00144AA882|nr:ThiJ/PfpI family protein [Arthroderma uncinatum]KAF3480971.1 ThiJ/PfpI family protein [Arthroderma uncinatum]
MRLLNPAFWALVAAANAFPDNTSLPLPQSPNDGLPANFGVVLFPAFQALDVFGPIDALNLLSLTRKLNLSIIAETLDPVSTQVRSPNINRFGSSFGEAVLPTHTFDTAPSLDVLLIPGGFGTEAPDLGPLLAYIKRTYPSLKYILTVCTGSELLAKTGILDGRYATTNKQVYNRVVKSGPKVNWVPEARWVADGNVWTSSGVSAGIDLTFAFIEAVYGTVVSNMVSEGMEYVRDVDWRKDPFAHYVTDNK